MKAKFTFSTMKNHRPVVLGIGYCRAQFLLNYLSPIAYNATRDGWACDLYEINDKYAIATGYNYARASTHKLTIEQLEELKTLERQCNVEHLDGEQRQSLLIAFLEKHFFVE